MQSATDALRYPLVWLDGALLCWWNIKAEISHHSQQKIVGAHILSFPLAKAGIERHNTLAILFTAPTFVNAKHQAYILHQGIETISYCSRVHTVGIL